MRKLTTVTVLLLAACSSSKGADSRSPEGGSPTGDASTTIDLTMRLTVPPGTELHQCQLVDVPSDTDLEVVELSHKYARGSHHFLLFATDLDTIPADLTGQYDCTLGNEPIMDHARGIVYGAQSPTGHSTFPPGIGLKIKAHRVFMMQAHYINISAAPVDATITMSFTPALPGTITTEAGFFIFYDPFIYVPPQAAASSSIRCGVTDDITLLYGFTHYHQRGTKMRVWNDPDVNTPAASPFHETSDWEHPNDFNGNLKLAKGSSVRMQCDYVNGDATEVFQGPNAATSEMCVYAGLYYPRLDTTFELCDGLSVVGSGTEDCITQAACISNCPVSDVPEFTHGGVLVGACWEKCVAHGCPGATDKVLSLSECVGRQCQDECAKGGDACNACAAAKCAEPFAACATHNCTQ